jgi:hypothetical protein
MQPLNEQATEIFHRLSIGLKKIGDHREWNNGTSIPICVEIVDKNGYGSLVSVANYFECRNGTMKDPDVVFLVDNERKVFPISYKQDNFGTDYKAAFLENGRWVVRAKLQEAIAEFCCHWMLNINRRQLDN